MTVKPGFKVIVWEHPDMGGHSVTIDKTTPTLNKWPWQHDNWGDRISSLRVDNTEIQNIFETTRYNLALVKQDVNATIERVLSIEADVRLLGILNTRADNLKTIVSLKQNLVLVASKSKPQKLD